MEYQAVEGYSSCFIGVFTSFLLLGQAPNVKSTGLTLFRSNMFPARCHGIPARPSLAGMARRAGFRDRCQFRVNLEQIEMIPILQIRDGRLHRSGWTGGAGLGELRVKSQKR